MTKRGAGCEKDACPVLRGTGVQLWLWIKYCGTAGKPGGYGENKPYPTAGEVSSLLENPRKNRRTEIAVRVYTMIASATAPTRSQRWEGRCLVGRNG